MTTTRILLRLSPAFSCVGLTIGCFLLSSLSPSASPEPDTQTIQLTYVQDFGVMTGILSLDEQELPLKREPRYSGNNIRRGLLKLNHDPGNWLPFACDISAGKLYLDRNRDLDLTNDPDGVLTTRGSGIRDGFRFSAETFVGGQKRTGQYTLFAYRDPQLNWQLYCHSCFIGQFHNHGKKWIIGVRSESASTNGLQLFIKTEAPDEIRLSASIPSSAPWVIDSVPLRFRLVDDRATSDQLSLNIYPADDLRLHRVRLAGQLDTLRLTGVANAVFDHPTSSILLPEGSYQVAQLKIPSGEETLEYKTLEVSSDDSSEIKAGGPITPKLLVRREGMYLLLDLQARGVGGEKYTAGTRSTNPSFAVFQGNRQVATGYFQYG